MSLLYPTRLYFFPGLPRSENITRSEVRSCLSLFLMCPAQCLVQSRMPEAYARGSAVGHLKHEKQTLQGPLIKSRAQTSLSTPLLLTAKTGKLHITCYVSQKESVLHGGGEGTHTHSLCNIPPQRETEWKQDGLSRVQKINCGYSTSGFK